MRRPPQLSLELKERFTWGGARSGAGRTSTGKAGVPHATRPELSKHHPVHITLRFRREIGNARKRNAFRAIRDAFKNGCESKSFRLVHYSVQGTHVHMLVEAENRDALSRALQGLKVRIARALNKILGRKGTVFAERYHEHVLKTPRETRNALAYVLLNTRHHAHDAGMRLTTALLDPCASGLAFDGWTERVECIVPDKPPVACARTWLLCVGWRKRGLISPNEIPSRKFF